jgi:cytoskeletal protein CcmA (bactofilin family)
MANKQDEARVGMDIDNMDDDASPPLKPFSRQRSKPARPIASTTPIPTFNSDGTRRVSGLAQSSRAHHDESASKHLIVGRDIELCGEIRSCDRLKVEGHVEAALSDARIIEISASGYFKGSATVDEADISGYFEGSLVVRDKLTVRSEGHITGSIRYGRIIIESGGQISGDMESLVKELDSSKVASNTYVPPDRSSEKP